MVTYRYQPTTQPFQHAIAQIITVSPALPTDQDAVVVTFDATQGNAALMNYTGDVYAHTGVKVDGGSSCSIVKSPKLWLTTTWI